MTKIVKRALFFSFFAYFFSWLLWLPLYAGRLGFSIPGWIPSFHFLGSFGPILAAFLFLFRYRDGAVSLHGTVRRMFTLPKIATMTRIEVAAITLSPVFFLVAVLVSQAVATNSQQGLLVFMNGVIGGSFLLKLVLDLFTFGFGEETGWRGVLVPLLQSRFSIVQTAVITTFIWAGWHLPMFLYRDGYVGMSGGMILGWFMSLFFGSVTLSYLLNRSKGSILIVALFHTTIDFAFTYDRLSQENATTIGVAVTVLGMVLLLKEVRNKSKKYVLEEV